ncbi:MAG TPA: FAD-dependent oxidoreductase [Bacteroidia bacterium]|nr:FAD-dependent oxidoreductase [Bacteroidia bacterium]HNP97574.1 FAD-dependent oxidoreductase [Bacteroidia bacterium]
MQRREFVRNVLLGGASLFVVRNLEACMPGDSFAHIQGSIRGGNSKTSHLLREGKFPPASKFVDVECLIVGGGISGLSAARKLVQAGITDIIVLDLEDHIGGNSHGGKNEVSAYPWGAHYLPLVNPGQEELISFLKEIGVIRSVAENGLPVYNEYYLCQDPEERLFLRGQWQEGIIPSFGLPDSHQAEVKRFLDTMQQLRYKMGKDGKEAFAIPAAESSQDAEFRELDKISMKEYMMREKYASPELMWYINYCCRDDFGTPADETSAWAGIHYFAGRKGVAANAEMNSVLTWPEGNKFLAEKLAAEFSDKIQTGQLIFNVRLNADFVEAQSYDVQSASVVCYRAKKVVLAVPQFVARRILNNTSSGKEIMDAFHYAPWMVANVTVKKPETRSGQIELCWDNVFYNSESLGYVNACHQHLSSHPGMVVLTYYLPLTKGSPFEERTNALKQTHRSWVEVIVKDLEQAHPGIGKEITTIDVWLWGHAMIRPEKNFMFSQVRQEAGKPIEGKIFFAHSDLSGMSIFEEAFSQGIRAAKEILEA